MNLRTNDPARSSRARIGARIEDIVVERDLAFVELARRVGLNVYTLSKWRSNRYQAPKAFDVLCRLADELGVSTDWLLGRTDERGTEAPGGAGGGEVGRG